MTQLSHVQASSSISWALVIFVVLFRFFPRRLLLVSRTDHRYSILLCCANREKGISGGLLTRESGPVNVPVITRLVGDTREHGRKKEVQMSEREERRTAQGVEYENVGEEYLQQRQLQKGAAGWV